MTRTSPWTTCSRWPSWRASTAEKILHLNQRIVEYAASRPHVHYLDYYPSMTLDGKSMNSNLTDDGVHPNSLGYDVMEVKLLEMLDQLQH